MKNVLLCFTLCELFVVIRYTSCMFADAALDVSLSMKADASPWDPVHSSNTPNGAHAVTGASIVPAGGIDNEFDLLSSRSKSPPTTSAAAAGTSTIHWVCLCCMCSKFEYSRIYTIKNQRSHGQHIQRMTQHVALPQFHQEMHLFVLTSDHIITLFREIKIRTM